ncbi:MAG TPA: hypothetical protein VF954_00635 [Acidimicrobiales bacterium]
MHLVDQGATWDPFPPTGDLDRGMLAAAEDAALLAPVPRCPRAAPR